MGGNAKAVYRSTGTVKIYDNRLAYAEKIHIGLDVPIQLFCDDVDELIRQINKHFIWPEKSIREGSIFFGSYECLRSFEDKEKFSKFKNVIGDIDIAVPQETIENLHKFLESSEEKKITDKFLYIGKNRNAFHGKKMNCIFFYSRCSKFVQIDFEAVSFQNERPEEYCKFIRSSSFEDIQKGVKGLAHKYLLFSIAKLISYKENIVILTDKSPLFPPEKIRIKLLDVIPHSLSFSKEGLRHKLEKQYRIRFPVMVEGKYAFKEISKKDSKFEKDIAEIFKILFSKTPSKKDLENFYSYVGLLEIVEKSFSRAKIQTLFLYLIEDYLWGPGAQELSRDSQSEDKLIKEVMISEFESKFPFLDRQKYTDKFVEKYYSNYRIRDDLE